MRVAKEKPKESATNSLFLMFIIGGIALTMGLLSLLYSAPDTPKVNDQYGQLESRYRSEVAAILENSEVLYSTLSCQYFAKQLVIYCGVNNSSLIAIRTSMIGRGWQFTSSQSNTASRVGQSLGKGLPEGKDLASFECSSDNPIMNCNIKIIYAINVN